MKQHSYLWAAAGLGAAFIVWALTSADKLRVDSGGVGRQSLVESGGVESFNSRAQLSTFNSQPPADGGLLFSADTTLDNAPVLFGHFLAWEEQVRTALGPYPDVVMAANTIRDDQTAWLRALSVAREEYARSPSGANADALRSAAGVVAAALKSAEGYYTQVNQVLQQQQQQALANADARARETAAEAKTGDSNAVAHAPIPPEGGAAAARPALPADTSAPAAPAVAPKVK